MRESQQRRRPALGKRNWTRGFSLTDKGDRIEECGGQGKERTRKWKKRNDRIHSEVKRPVSSRRSKAEVGDKRKILSERNIKGGNSSEKLYGWMKRK